MDIGRKQQHYVMVNRVFNKYIKIMLQFGTLAVVSYRLSSWTLKQVALVRFVLWPLVWPVSIIIQRTSGIYINPRANIGPGFVIHNFSSIVIENVEIGDNLTINQCVHVGYDWTRRGLPTIGNNVFLGSGAKVLGDVTVGDNAVVAANCLVSRSVEPRSLVVGVPGLVVARNLSDDYISTVPARSK